MKENGTKKTGRAVTWTWREGKYWDLWMFPHLFSGIVVGLVFYIFEVTALIGVLISAVLFILWEFAERASGIYEYLSNSIMDVVVGLVGLVLVYLLYPGFGVILDIVFLILASIVLGLLNLLGWLAYTKRVK